MLTYSVFLYNTCVLFGITMKNVTMSFKAPIEFKDSIDFLAQYGNTNATKIILE